MRAFITLSPIASRALESHLDTQQTIGFYSKKENAINNATLAQELEFMNQVCERKDYLPDFDKTVYQAGIFTPKLISDLKFDNVTQWWNPGSEAKYQDYKGAMGYMTGKGEHTQGGNWLVFYPATRRIAYGGRRAGLVKILEAAGINNLHNNNFENFQYPEGGTHTPWIKPWQVVNKENQDRVAANINKTEISKFTELSSEDVERFNSLASKFQSKVLKALTVVKSDESLVKLIDSAKTTPLAEVISTLRKMSKVEGFRRDRMEGFLKKLVTSPNDLDVLKILFNVRISPKAMDSFGGPEGVYAVRGTKRKETKVQTPVKEKEVPSLAPAKEATPEPKPVTEGIKPISEHLNVVVRPNGSDDSIPETGLGREFAEPRTERRRRVLNEIAVMDKTVTTEFRTSAESSFLNTTKRLQESLDKRRQMFDMLIAQSATHFQSVNEKIGQAFGLTPEGKLKNPTPVMEIEVKTIFPEGFEVYEVLRSRGNPATLPVFHLLLVNTPKFIELYGFAVNPNDLPEFFKAVTPTGFKVGEKVSMDENLTSVRVGVKDYVAQPVVPPKGPAEVTIQALSGTSNVANCFSVLLRLQTHLRQMEGLDTVGGEFGKMLRQLRDDKTLS